MARETVAAGDVVRVRLGRQHWSVMRGRPLTFGRSRDRDIQLGHEPEDDFVSRHAGEIAELPRGLLIHNSSTTQSLLLRPLPGVEVRIPPQTGVVRSRPELFHLLVPGRYGSTYTLVVDNRPTGNTDEVAEARSSPVGAAPTRAGASRLSARERLMLAALCEPRLLLAGDEARPATYGEVAERLGTTKSAVKSCLDNLRHRLSDEDGIPGLRSDEEEGRDTGNYLVPLSTWAVETGCVSLEVLRLLVRVGREPA